MDQLVNEYIPSVSQSKNISSLSRDWGNHGEWREGICERTTTISLYECGYIYLRDEVGQEAFAYELCSYPTVLCGNKLLRRSRTKSEFF